MSLYIGSDHAGFEMKTALLEYLKKHGYDCEDKGTFSADSVDYPDYGADLARRVAAGEFERGILICGSGIGISIAANKVHGIRAALCHNAYTAEMARRHNDANVIAMGARLIGDYRSASKYGQSRLAITWSRLLMPDGQEIALDEAAIDPSGAAGARGDVDAHWGDVLGAAFLGTMINVGVATTEDPQLTYGAIGVVRDPVDQAVTDGVQRTASNVAGRTVDRSLAIPPTIRIEAGTRIAVMVSRRGRPGGSSGSSAA